MTKDINVLFLDDEENILNSIKRIFVNGPFGIKTTIDPDEAMESIGQNNIKVVFSDQRMPKTSGVDFLKKVKDKYPKIVRILFTGYSDVKAVEDSINVSEVYRFINKPWNAEDLELTVKQAVRYYDLIDENNKLFKEMKTKNQELLELNRKITNTYKSQTEFTSTVSHELRTPLASIKSTVDLVLSGEPGELNEYQMKFLRKTKDNVDRLNRLINDILDLSKMESGKIEFNIVPGGQIGDVVNDVIEVHQSVAKEKNLFLKGEIPDRLPKIPVDVDKMHQVFNNLINNAIKFTKEGGITVSCVENKDKNHIEVNVQDTGQGIKEAEMCKLFSKFQQLGDPHKHAGGTGLGLAICKEIIARHGGKIWAESDFGKGTCFKFILPINERRRG